MENSLLPKLQMCEIKLQNTTNGLFFFFFDKAGTFAYASVYLEMSGSLRCPPRKKDHTVTTHFNTPTAFPHITVFTLPHGTNHVYFIPAM